MATSGKDTWDEERYAALIERLTDYARREPRRYRMRVGLLAALGYAYIGLILALLLGLLALVAVAAVTGHLNALTIKGGFFLVVLVGVILRALWVTIPPPSGIALTRQSAPALFEMLDRTTRALDAPAFHHVLLTDDYNAGVQQSPRLGIFGGFVNYLVLGLPLMAALTPRQFLAVVAHEVGHLSGNHSRFSGWVYRVRKTWAQLLQNLHTRRHKGTVIFEWFFRWYAPYFGAYSFVLARSDEYAADRCAAEVAGREAAAEALVNIQVRGQFLNDDFWPGLLKQARAQADPPAAPYAQMFQALREPVPAEQAPKWLGRALGEKTGLHDTHPSLADRLGSLGYRPAPADGGGLRTDPPLPPPAAPLAETAAQHYLGPGLGALTYQLEGAWRSAVAPRWRKRYAQAQEALAQLRVLDARAASGEALTPDEQWARARWTAELVGNGPAIPLLERILTAQPDSGPAHFALGSALLEEGDARGLEALERAMALDEEAILSSCEAAFGFLKAAGRLDQAEGYRRRAQDRYDLTQKAEGERGRLLPQDALLPSGLPTEVIVRLRAQLWENARVKAAYVARKSVQYRTDQPYYVVAIEPRLPAFRLSSDTATGDLLRALVKQIELPGDFRLVSLENHYRPMRESLRRMPEALLFRR